jgi:CelD/BcsL family acetyltransferase involved in cellulose biosynthesis
VAAVAELRAVPLQPASAPGIHALPGLVTPIRAAHSAAIHVDVLVDRGLDLLAWEWESLHQQAATASIFNSWTWQREWWRAYGRGRSLRVLVARRHNELVGILPLYIQSTRLMGIPIRVAHLLGTGGDTYPDDLGPLLVKGLELPVAAALAGAALDMDGVDVLRLADMDSRSHVVSALQLGAEQVQRHAQFELSQQIRYIELPRTWNHYLASVSGHRRASIRKVRRRLSASGARFYLWNDIGNIDEAVEQLARLHRMRWEASYRRSTAFCSAEYMQIHRAVIASTLKRGWLRMYCLEISGRLVAMLYAYRFRNSIFAMQAGFDPDYARHRVGYGLLGYAIEHAISEGNERFDFLRGEHSYKEQLATGTRTTVSLTVLRRGIRPAVYQLCRMALPWSGRAAWSRSACDIAQA